MVFQERNTMDMVLKSENHQRDIEVKKSFLCAQHVMQSPCCYHFIPHAIHYDKYAHL
jgi:hypothetical protein